MLANLEEDKMNEIYMDNGKVPEIMAYCKNLEGLNLSSNN